MITNVIHKNTYIMAVTWPCILYISHWFHWKCWYSMQLSFYAGILIGLLSPSSRNMRTAAAFFFSFLDFTHRVEQVLSVGPRCVVSFLSVRDPSIHCEMNGQRRSAGRSAVWRFFSGIPSRFCRRLARTLWLGILLDFSSWALLWTESYCSTSATQLQLTKLHSLSMQDFSRHSAGPEIAQGHILTWRSMILPNFRHVNL